MKIRRLLTLLLVVLSIAMFSCKKDGASTTTGGGSNPINPTNCDDPEGTITANLRNDDGYIDMWHQDGGGFRLKMNAANNFITTPYISNFYHVNFVNLGEVDGLGCVENIPESGWSNQVAVIPGNGYIIKAEYWHPNYGGSYTQYVKVYVTRYILSANNEILGAELKYQEFKDFRVVTKYVTDITSTSATCGGNVTGDGGHVVTARGVCWSTSQNPTISDAHTTDGTGTGLFTSNITGLTPYTTYYVRAYATNNTGTSYGEQQTFRPEHQGAIGGLFSVSATQQVRFSQGNLQYQASTNTWRFAENQYDYIGSANSSISSSYSGWIDLFGWGASGYNHGAVCYQPWSTSTDYSDYYAYGSSSYNLNDQTGKADWGYNAISNGGNTENQWRTLTVDEWVYVFNTRGTNSGIRYAKAQVNGINGVILLPDDWSASTYSLNSTNTSGAGFATNTINGESWSTMEAAGAVFLPAAGWRYGTDVEYVYYDGSVRGYYWSASYLNSLNARNVVFLDGLLRPDLWSYRRYGQSVRLVRSAQ